MDNRLINNNQDAQIDDALKSYPLAPMPRKINGQVIAQIKIGARPRVLTLNDLWLWLLIAACIAGLFFSTQFLPPIFIAKLRIQGILLYQNYLVLSRLFSPVILLGVAALISALAVPFFQRQR